MNPTAPSGRRPWAAALLSFLCTGLGHVYAGRIARGLVLFFLSLLVMPVIAGLTLLAPSKLVLILILASFVFLFVLYVFAIIDAWWVARPSRVTYRLRDFNRVPVYVLFALVGLLYPALSAVVVRSGFLEAFRVATASMQPTFEAGDRILVRKALSDVRAAQRGQVVVFRPPGEREIVYVKRIIALPGDRIAVRDGVPILNGAALPRDTSGGVEREFLEAHAYTVCMGGSGAAFEEQVVPAGQVFLLGDCRASSRDSRDFGFVPVGDLLGVADYLYWPSEAWSRFGVVP